MNIGKILQLFFFIAGFIQSQAQQTYLTNANLIDVVGGRVVPGMTLVIEGENIREIKRSNAKDKFPDSALIIDVKGKFIMPGMIDAHIHFFQSGGLYTRPDGLNLGKFYSYEKDQRWIADNREDLMRRYLACGITTVIDVGGPISNFEVREYCNHSLLSPNAFVTGPLISTYEPPNLDKKDPPIIKVSTEEEAREIVRKQLPYHPDFIKIWYIVLPGQSADKTLPIVKAAIDESHKSGLKVAVHATEYHTARLAVENGCDILVHSIDDSLLDRGFLQLLKSKNITLIPTLLVASKYNETFTQQFRLTAHDFRFANPFMLGTLFDLSHIPAKDAGLDYMRMRKILRIPSREDSLMLKNLILLEEAGINIASGTDAGNIGTEHAASFYDELLAMSQAGLTNAEILKASTINAAKGFGFEKTLGSLERGKKADLLLLNGNPLDSLTSLENLIMIYHRGRAIRTDSLLRVSPEMLVQKQLNGYNGHNIEAFLEPYSDSVEIYNFYGQQLLFKGKEHMRITYDNLFRNQSGLHCQSVNRIVMGNIVIDQETNSGTREAALHAAAIYKIENGKIARVYFVF